MTAARLATGAAFALLLAALPGPPSRGQDAPVPPAAASSSTWDFSGSLSAYVLPDDENFLLPIVYADRDRLHLEARYNYESLDAGSIFAGWALRHEGEVEVEFTPMAGVVFGALEGIAPGIALTLAYKAFELYTEAEYVIDLQASDADFFYSWSEAAFRIEDRFRVGLTTQRTRVYQSDRDIQRALLLGLDVGRVSLTAHLFNPFDDDHFYVFAAAMEF